MSSSVFKVTLVALNETDDIKQRELLLSPTMPIQIGRSSRTESKNITAAASNCYLRSPVVSRNHAIITVDESSEGAVLTDLASMHGSCVNGTQLEKNIRRPLHHGDVLTFGTGVLRGEVTHEPPKFLFECVKHTETQPLKHGFKVTRIEDTKRTTFVVPESDVSSASDNGSDMVEDQVEIHSSDALSDEDDTRSIDSDAASETFDDGDPSHFMVLDDFNSPPTSQQGGHTASDVKRDVEKVDGMHAAAATLHSRPWETGFANSYVVPEAPAASCLPLSETQWYLPPRPEDFAPHRIGRFNPSVLRPIALAQSNTHQQQTSTTALCTPPRTHSAENLPELSLPNEPAQSEPLAAPESSAQQCPEADSDSVKAKREKTGISIGEIVHSGPSIQLSEVTGIQTSRPNGLKRKADELSPDVEPEDPAPTLKSVETDAAAAQPKVQSPATDVKAAAEDVRPAELSPEHTKPTPKSEGARHKRMKLQLAASAVAGAVVGGLGVFATLLSLPDTLFE